MAYGDRYDTERYGPSRGREVRGSSSGWRGDNPDRDRYAREGGRPHRGQGDDDRGFIDRAGDEVRSWFGDDEAERRRQEDQRRYEREHGYAADRSNSDRNLDRGGRGYFGSDYDRSSDDYPRGDHGQDSSFGGAGTYGRPAETWGGSGFGGDDNRGRRFDRIDAGSTGTHGAHPMSSPVGGTGYGAGYGIAPGGGYGGSSAAYRGSGGQQQQRSGGERGRAMMGGMAGGSMSGSHDPHYSQWRQRQIEALDRDYDEYRREHQSKFEQEFGGWRQKREGQRSSLSKVREHMEVLGSDGEHVGTVDKVRGDRIILTKNDEAAGGHHHSIPCSWIESVDDKVTISKKADEARRVWTDEENNRALFEREGDRGDDGPHVLNRSFSGTYGSRDD